MMTEFRVNGAYLFMTSLPGPAPRMHNMVEYEDKEYIVTGRKFIYGSAEDWVIVYLKEVGHVA